MRQKRAKRNGIERVEHAGSALPGAALNHLRAMVERAGSEGTLVVKFTAVEPVAGADDVVEVSGDQYARRRAVQ